MERGLAESDIAAREHRFWKLTVPPENTARAKSAWSKTTPVKSRSCPCQEWGWSVRRRWSLMSRMTVCRISRVAG
jgi:hypothetical protein